MRKYTLAAMIILLILLVLFPSTGAESGIFFVNSMEEFYDYVMLPSEQQQEYFKVVPEAYLPLDRMYPDRTFDRVFVHYDNYYQADSPYNPRTNQYENINIGVEYDPQYADMSLVEVLEHGRRSELLYVDFSNADKAMDKIAATDASYIWGVRDGREFMIWVHRASWSENNGRIGGFTFIRGPHLISFDCLQNATSAVDTLDQIVALIEQFDTALARVKQEGWRMPSQEPAAPAEQPRSPVVPITIGAVCALAALAGVIVAVRARRAARRGR